MTDRPDGERKGPMESVQVEIYGQTYSIKGMAEPAHIRELAAYVDARMRDIQKSTGTTEPHRVAILAALTISEEYHSLRERSEALEHGARASVRRILDLTEQWK